MLYNNSTNKESSILFYSTPTGEIKIEVFFQDETVWLTQKLLAELFDTTKQNISLHLNNIFREDELSEKSVVKDFLTTAGDLQALEEIGKQAKCKGDGK